MKRICVLGMGYIGLPTAAMFATHGFHVTGVDVNAQTVDILNSGEIHIEEPGLKTVVQTAIQSGNLVVSQQPQPADVFILAVPTPLLMNEASSPDSSHGGVPHAEMSYVRAATRSLLPHLQKGNLVILESTSPPETTVGVVAPILEESGLKVGEDLFVAHCPERVLPGRILEELVNNDRVIGGMTAESAEMAKELYSSFVKGPIFLTDATTAEMVKLMENTYRDVNIALANELAVVAEHVGINVWEAIELANRHPRVNIHKPGPGVGGHCIAVDPWFIAAAAPAITPLIQTARRINDAMPAHVVEMVRQAVEGIENPVVACLGLAYKANVDDIRESPSMEVVKLLGEAGYEVRAFDPHVPNRSINEQVDSLENSLKDAHCVVLLTDHAEFQQLILQKFCVPDMILIDTRNISHWKSSSETSIPIQVLGNGRTKHDSRKLKGAI